MADKKYNFDFTPPPSGGLKFIRQFLPEPARKLGRKLWTAFETKDYHSRVKNILQLEVNLTSHCNLDCAYCDHFSPIAREEFTDIKDLERDFKRISELSGRRILQMRLLGGEPLLHPEIERIVELASFYFDYDAAIHNNVRSIYSLLQITTNGILLDKMTDEFWKTCAKTKCAIFISAYPIKLKMDWIAEKAKKFGVQIIRDRGEKTMYRLKIDPSGSFDITKNFAVCEGKNHCCTLKNGKIYTCVVPPHIYRLNEQYNLNIPDEESNSIDIHYAKDIKEILEFLAKPIPFCRFCARELMDYNLPWRHSRKELSEWI